MFAVKVAFVDTESAHSNGAVCAGGAEPCHCSRSWELCGRVCDIVVFYQNPGNEGGRQRKCSEPRQRGASISAGESHDYDAHLLYVWGESGRICLRCSAARLCAAQSKRRFAGSGTGYILRWRCHDSWQPAGRSAAQTQGQGARHLFDDAVFIRHRKFPAGIFQRAGIVVRRADHWMDTCASHERQSGCDS